MEKVSLAYRTENFSPFVLVLQETGRSKYGIDVDAKLIPGVEQAEADIVDGGIDLIIGHHFTPFVSQVTGSCLTWLAIGQNYRDYKLVTRPGINKFEELRGKKVAVANNPCQGLNMRLMLKQMGLEGQVTVVEPEGRWFDKMLDVIAEGDVAGGFVETPADILAKRRGLRVHEDTPILEVIMGECITTIPKFIHGREETIRRFLKAYLHSACIFKTDKAHVKKAIRSGKHGRGSISSLFDVDDEELVEAFYQRWSGRWEKKPYPTLGALQNTKEKATRFDGRAALVDPFTVVDMHYLVEIDRTGFIDRLYEGK
jgi:ABC-type nitrate/sulfonate/bicarbonate transport system substrate-binding protein